MHTVGRPASSRVLGRLLAQNKLSAVRPDAEAGWKVGTTLHVVAGCRGELLTYVSWSKSLLAWASLLDGIHFANFGVQRMAGIQDGLPWGYSSGNPRNRRRRGNFIKPKGLKS